jgi:hypothetical protein
MRPNRTLLAAALVAAAVLAAGAPAAGASTIPIGRFPFLAGYPRYQAAPPLRAAPFAGTSPVSGPCSSAEGGDGRQGSTGSVLNVACAGGGLVFIGPSIGQVATVIGPTIIGPAVIGSVIVSAGNAVGGG